MFSSFISSYMCKTMPLGLIVFARVGSGEILPPWVSDCNF